MQDFKSSTNKSGKSFAGLILIAIGAGLLLRQFNFIFFPYWIFTWPMILIVVGLYQGSRQGFDRPGVLVLLILGSIFLINRIDLGFQLPIWPIFIITAGVWLLLRRSGNTDFKSNFWDKRVDNPEDPTKDPLNFDEPTAGNNNYAYDKIDSISVFGGVKKNIVSKNFTGGEIINFFGGTEINLMQADFKGRIVVEVVQVFGGTKMVVPANWAVHSEMVAVFGGIDDKRPAQALTENDKVLIIRGTSLFGGISIKSY